MVYVLNGGFQVLPRSISWQAAISRVVDNRAYILESDETKRIRSTFLDYPMPISIVQNSFEYIPETRRDRKAEGLRTNVKSSEVRARDGFSCAYCGDYAGTVDHIVPQHKGGPNTWLNLVAACCVCNGQKDNMSLKEFTRRTGKVLLFEPFVPDSRAVSPYQARVNELVAAM